MSNVSALNRAILAGQRLEVANAAMISLNNAYVACRASSMPSALQDALCNAERELVKHIDQLRDAYEVAHRIAQETKNFRVSDNVYVDVPKGYTIKRVSTVTCRRIVVQKDGTPREYVSAGEVLTHEANGDDVGGFVYTVNGELQPVLCSTELTALKSIIAALQGE